MSTHCEFYTVGWICAIDTEYLVACELLDEEYEADRVPKIDSTRDPNIYTFGRILHHNVVVACLPKGRYGVSSAAIVAVRMRTTFTALRFGLMVGIAGGAPSIAQDIRLGDIVVSSPTPRHGGVIQYDFGKAIQDHEFDETGHLASPPESLLHALSHMSMQHKRKGHRVAETISAMVEKNPRLKDFGPSNERIDRLYRSSYTHVDGGECECQKSDADHIPGVMQSPNLVPRKARPPDIGQPVIHYGLIASASRLMKNAIVRDALSSKHEVLCFEMEAAGLMDSFPCVVIRGICDYSDTHKNDSWQSYAAASAAAYAKELLGIIPAATLQNEIPTDPKENPPRPPRTRVFRACDRCGKKKIKCDYNHPSCSRCKNDGLVCNYKSRNSAVGPQQHCQNCKQRKVKCDMSFPSCSSCKKGMIFCEYALPTPKSPSGTAGNDLSSPSKDKFIDRGSDGSMSNNIRQTLPQSNSQADLFTQSTPGRSRRQSPTVPSSRNDSPMSFTETSTEVLEYNAEGRVTKRTYSRTSSRSPVLGDTFGYDRQEATKDESQTRWVNYDPYPSFSTKDESQIPWPTYNPYTHFLAYDQVQYRGRPRSPPLFPYKASIPVQEADSKQHTIVDCEDDLDFFERTMTAVNHDDRQAYLAHLDSIRTKVRTIIASHKEQQEKIEELTRYNASVSNPWSYPWSNMDNKAV